jgi:hypothetical protein
LCPRPSRTSSSWPPRRRGFSRKRSARTATSTASEDFSDDVEDLVGAELAPDLSQPLEELLDDATLAGVPRDEVEDDAVVLLEIPMDSPGDSLLESHGVPRDVVTPGMRSLRRDKRQKILDDPETYRKQMVTLKGLISKERIFSTYTLISSLLFFRNKCAGELRTDPLFFSSRASCLICRREGS